MTTGVLAISVLGGKMGIKFTVPSSSRVEVERRISVVRMLYQCVSSPLVALAKVIDITKTLR
jgi:hypothetical protein